VAPALAVNSGPKFAEIERFEIAARATSPSIPGGKRQRNAGQASKRTMRAGQPNNPFECPLRVNRVVPAANQPLPVYPDDRHMGDAPTLRDDKSLQTDSPVGQNLLNFSDDRFGHRAFSLQIACA
jgi:hypothetical protein